MSGVSGPNSKGPESVNAKFLPFRTKRAKLTAGDQEWAVLVSVGAAHVNQKGQLGAY